MEEKELLEIEVREAGQAKKNVEEMIRTKRMSDISLLYKDKFDLNNEKACISYSSEICPGMLIPLHDKVLVQIPPIPSSDAFEQRTRCSVSDLIDWRRRGWIETFLSASPRFYAGLDYLDELIQVSPCGSIRTGLHTATLSGGTRKFNLLLSKGRSLFGALKADEMFRHLYGEKDAEEHWRSSLASAYADLSAFKLTDVIGWIEEQASDDLNMAGLVTYVSSVFLTEPFLSGLRRTCIYASERRRVAEKIYSIAQPNVEAFFAPCWLADVYKNLETTIPEKTDIDQINAVRKHSENFVQATKSLDEEIDRSVKERFQGGELNRSEKEMILAKREEFRRRWFEDVVPAFADLSQRDKLWSMAMTGSIVAPALALPAFTGVLGIPPALTALAASDKIKKLVDPAAEFLSTFFECNPIHLGFYKVHRELKKVKRAGK
jgi:hypothetical protein